MINIGDLLSRQARLAPNREATVDLSTDRRVSYQTMDRNVRILAARLQAAGLIKGERVGILLPNGIDYLEVFFACARLGLVAVPMNSRLGPVELVYIARDAEIKALAVHSQFAPASNAICEEIDSLQLLICMDYMEGDTAGMERLNLYQPGSAPALDLLKAGDDDILYLMYTSGTTGNPKGTVHTHRSAFWAILTLVNSGDYRERDRYLACTPLFHVGALLPTLVCIYRSATAIIMGDFSPDVCWRAIEEERINITLLPPAILLMMKQAFDPEKYDISSIRWVMCGSAPVPVQMIKDYRAMGMEIFQAYGITEAGGPAAILGVEDAIRHAGSTGKAMFHSDIRIVNDLGQDCAPGDRGEIWVAGPHVMTSYWNLPEATDAAFTGPWYHTGDVGVVDEDGFITIVDRIKDMIISGGENIYPAELENTLLGLDGVTECAVIGVPSEKWGGVPVAVITRSRDSLTEQDVHEYCREKLASYKKIAAVTFVESLPRNATGKVLKAALRERFSALSLP